MQNTSKINTNVRENRDSILQATDFSQKKEQFLRACFSYFYFFLVVVKESSGEDKLLLDSHKPTIHSKSRILRNTNLTSR